MGKIAIVFPGQASQYVGMGKDLYEAKPEVRKLYELASDEIGEDIAKLSFEGPEETLKRTRFTQPAILLHSLAVLAIMKDDLPKANYTAGHSLGEYGALALAGVMSVEEAIKSVVKRASLMEEACQMKKGTMAAVMGLDESKVREICETASSKGVVVPANFNSYIQIVISGSVEGVEEAVNLAKEAGAKRVMMIPVGGAFHSPLMEPARDGMKEYLSDMALNKPNIPVVPNVTAKAEYDAVVIKELLVEQLTSPVLWHQTMQYFQASDVDTLIEIGPGKVLAGLAKRELKGAKLHNIDKLEDIKNFEMITAG